MKKEEEEQIRLIVRDELARVDAEKQLACDHARSGTINDDNDLICDDCGKSLEGNDSGPPPDMRGGMSLSLRSLRGTV